MKKSIFKVAALVFMAALLNLFISCKEKIMGYSVLLWNMPEYQLQSGDIVPVYIRSNISHVYVAGVALKDETNQAQESDELEKIEIIRMPTGRYRMAHAVTATQKAILSAFGVDSDWVREQASSIADMLENQTEQ